MNDMDPSPLFYRVPNQDEFNKSFGIFSNDNHTSELRMGFCLSDCFNYRSSVIYMSPFLLNNHSEFVVESIKKAWNEQNLVKETQKIELTFPSKLQIETDQK